MTKKKETVSTEMSVEEKLKNLLAAIKKSGEGKEYDCLLGLSGGLDSSYMLHLAVKATKSLSHSSQKQSKQQATNSASKSSSAWTSHQANSMKAMVFTT